MFKEGSRPVAQSGHKKGWFLDECCSITVFDEAFSVGWRTAMQEDCAFTHAEILGLKLLFALMDQVRLSLGCCVSCLSAEYSTTFNSTFKRLCSVEFVLLQHRCLFCLCGSWPCWCWSCGIQVATCAAEFCVQPRCACPTDSATYTADFLISVLPVVTYVLCWIGTKLFNGDCPVLIRVRLLRAGGEGGEGGAGAVIAAMPCIVGRTVLLASF